MPLNTESNGELLPPNIDGLVRLDDEDDNGELPPKPPLSNDRDESTADETESWINDSGLPPPPGDKIEEVSPSNDGCDEVGLVDGFLLGFDDDFRHAFLASLQPLNGTPVRRSEREFRCAWANNEFVQPACLPATFKPLRRPELQARYFLYALYIKKMQLVIKKILIVHLPAWIRIFGWCKFC